MYVCVCVYIYIVYRFFSIEQFTMCTTETVHFRNVAITLVCVLECYSDPFQSTLSPQMCVT